MCTEEIVLACTQGSQTNPQVFKNVKNTHAAHADACYQSCLLPSLLFVCWSVYVSEDVGQNPVGPVSSDRIQDAVELNHTHGFGV